MLMALYNVYLKIQYIKLKYIQYIKYIKLYNYISDRYGSTVNI